MLFSELQYHPSVNEIANGIVIRYKNRSYTNNTKYLIKLSVLLEFLTEVLWGVVLKENGGTFCLSDKVLLPWKDKVKQFAVCLAPPRLEIT